MSNGYLGKTTNKGRDVIQQQASSEIESRFGEMPGEIVEFDPMTQMAVVQPLYKPKIDGVPFVLPQLLEVPVRFDRCARGGLTYPIQPGDKVCLRPQMRDTSKYHAEGEFVANDARSFSLSDMEAYIDGGESLIEPIEGFDADNVHFRFGAAGSFGLHGSEIGQVKLQMTGGELIDLLIQGFTALAAENALTNRTLYGTIAAQLTVSKLA